MPLIIPSILSDSLKDIQEKLDRIANETSLKRVQIDITDPDYVHELTVFPIDLLELNTHDLQLDIHLMTNDPINDVIECSQIPGIHEIVAQVERMTSQEAFIEHVESFKLKTGLSLDYTTPIESIDDALLSKLSSIQIMGVAEGAQGRPFAGTEVLKRIREARELAVAHKGKIEIVVDGGVNEETALSCIEAGADTLVVGSFLWESQDLAGTIAKLQATA